MKHESCGTAEKVWLPYEVDGRSRGLKPQSYCVHCGAVEKISSKSKNKNKKAKRMGYYTSILPRLGITKVQIRLIAKELERIQGFDFDNVNSMTRKKPKMIATETTEDTEGKNTRGSLGTRGGQKYTTRSEQEKLFIDAVKKHSKVREDTIRAFL